MQCNEYIILAGTIKGFKRTSAKEAEACVILFALKKANEFKLSKVHILSNALCVGEVKQGKED